MVLLASEPEIKLKIVISKFTDEILCNFLTFLADDARFSVERFGVSVPDVDLIDVVLDVIKFIPLLFRTALLGRVGGRSDFLCVDFIASESENDTMRKCS